MAVQSVTTAKVAFQGPEDKAPVVITIYLGDDDEKSEKKITREEAFEALKKIRKVLAGKGKVLGIHLEESSSYKAEKKHDEIVIGSAEATFIKGGEGWNDTLVQNIFEKNIYKDEVFASYDAFTSALEEGGLKMLTALSTAEQDAASRLEEFDQVAKQAKDDKVDKPAKKDDEHKKSNYRVSQEAKYLMGFYHKIKGAPSSDSMNGYIGEGEILKWTKRDFNKNPLAVSGDENTRKKVHERLKKADKDVAREFEQVMEFIQLVHSSQNEPNQIKGDPGNDGDPETLTDWDIKSLTNHLGWEREDLLRLIAAYNTIIDYYMQLDAGVS